MFRWLLAKGEKIEGEVASGFFDGDGVYDLDTRLCAEAAFLICLAFLLRYLGRTYSSQNACHCCAV